MDVRVISPSSKQQKLCEVQGIDIISNLPEYVLHCILSLLSTKEVIRLSVLSKRWQFLWTSIPNIDLRDDITSERIIDKVKREMSEISFLKFVTRVLTHHDDSDINKLRVSARFPEKPCCLDLWLRIAVNHNVKELCLGFDSEAQYGFPSCLFTSRSLTVLELSAEVAFDAPPCTLFPNLKKLDLANVRFSDDVSAQRLFSSCPVLERLSLWDCDWTHIEHITISIPTLKSLTIKYVDVYTGFDALGCMINIISCINLAYFECSSDLIVNICTGELPSLDSADIYVRCPQDVMDGYAYRAQRLFLGLINVNVLTIYDEVLECTAYMDEFPFPIFYKLTRLEVIQKNIFGYCKLMMFLDQTPKLEHLDLNEIDVDKDEPDKLDEILEMVPSCFNSFLKKFSISHFRDTLTEKQLLGFVLKNATVLESMIIHCCSSLSKEETMNLICTELNQLPKVSKSCVIKLCGTSDL